MLRTTPRLLGLLLAFPAAAAEPAQRPDMKPGDRWTFAVSYTIPPGPPVPNRTWIVEAVADDAIVATEDGEPLRLTPELNVLESPRAKESNPGLLRFPLAVGDSWRYASRWHFKPKNSQGDADVRVTVVALETVEVPAGTFEAFKLEAREWHSGKSPVGSLYNAETRRTYWYAPAARAVVKSISHNPYLGPTTVVLVSFGLRP